MAEALVEPPSAMTRFFCHQCSVEIDNLLPDFTCPRCSTGFIEQLERNRVDNAGMDVGNEDLSDAEIDVTGLADVPIILRSGSEPSRSSSASRRRRTRRSRGADGSDSPYSSDTTRNTSTRNPQQGRLPMQIDSLIQDFFLNLSDIGFGFQGQAGQPPVLFLGNPGDYVWGQHGLDSIVTHLLNQMDGSGPPPLPRKLIDEIPTTAVSQKQVESKLQCSVCWEDFVLLEPVRQLPCLHFYHAPCIVPWLELHGTCPICRQSLGEQTTDQANEDTVGPSLAALFRAANESSSSSSSSSTTSSPSLETNSANDSSNEI